MFALLVLLLVLSYEHYLIHSTKKEQCVLISPLFWGFSSFFKILESFTTILMVLTVEQEREKVVLSPQ